MAGWWLPLAQAEPLEGTLRIAAVIATAVLVGIVLELVRRRRLGERYALLWMALTFALLVLAVWNDLLVWLSDALGFELAANFLFVAAFGVGILLLLHFSVASSRLSDETKILAQEVARLDQQVRAARGAEPNGTGPADNGDEPVSEPAAESEPAPSKPADPPVSA
jgi:hypothetical protein